MNTENPMLTAQIAPQSHENLVKETYHAQQIKVHGKLERLTLQGNYPVTGGGTGNAGEE